MVAPEPPSYSGAILVTGGAGYIGSHTAKALRRSGRSVVIFDNLSAGHKEAALGAPVIEGDIRDVEAVRRAIRESGATAVMHFAALLNIPDSVRDPSSYYRNNVAGTLATLEAMTAEGCRQFVFSSTCAVYGEPTEIPIAETHPTAPINPYGQTKLAIEQALPHFERAYGIRSIRLRYFNAAGADPECELGPRHDPLTHLIPLVLRAAAGVNPNIKVFGTDYPTPDGTAVRDYIHVMDLCEAHLKAIEYLMNGGQTRPFNLGVGRGFSVKEVIDSVKRVTGRDFEVVLEGRRPGDASEVIASPALANEVFGWKAGYVDIDEIVAHNWAWQLKTMGGKAP